jgi:hypothetical protein
LYQPFLLIAEKKSALAPDLQLLQLTKVSHENLTLKSIFFWKNLKTEKNPTSLNDQKNSLQDSLNTLKPIFDF